MPNLTGILAGLSGLPQGYMQGAQFAQQQDYRQILAEMARAQMQDRLQKIAAQGTAFQSLLSPDNPATPLGGLVGSQTSPLAPPPAASTSLAGTCLTGKLSIANRAVAGPDHQSR